MDLLMLLCIILLPMMASLYIRSNYNTYSAKKNNKDISGFEVAREILDKNGLQKIYVVETGGVLTDHYDPKRKVVRLSKEVFNGTSISAMAIAAHEVGHAIQDKEGYAYFKFRSLMYPLVKITSSFSYFVIMIGLLAEITNLFMLGIILVSIGLLFQIITLPVEFNASKKGEKELNKLKLSNNRDNEGIKSVLTAAALTYVAGVLASLLDLLRLISIFNSRD